MCQIICVNKIKIKDGQFLPLHRNKRIADRSEKLSLKFYISAKKVQRQ